MVVGAAPYFIFLGEVRGEELGHAEGADAVLAEDLK